MPDLVRVIGDRGGRDYRWFSRRLPAFQDAVRCLQAAIAAPAGRLSFDFESSVFMAISPEQKREIIKEFGQNDQDTGSPQVQIAILTAEIQSVTEHLKTHPKDHSGRRGLLAHVSRRRSLLDYLKARSPESYVAIIRRLGIRK